MQTRNHNKFVIIDDDKELAETARWEVEAAGYEPILIVDGRFGTVDDLVSQIPMDVCGVLCDHRLNKSGLANFYGADLVAALYDRQIPALLDTQFYDMDSDVSIRRRRHKIPVLLGRDRVDAPTLKTGIETCLLEFKGMIADDRKPYRNILWIDEVTQESYEEVVDVIVPGWNPHQAVRLPSSLIQEWILDFQPTIGDYLIANVNIGAEHSEDLYFTHFELAPEPDEIDGNP